MTGRDLVEAIDGQATKTIDALRRRALLESAGDARWKLSALGHMVAGPGGGE